MTTRLAKLTAGPVLRTLGGARARVDHLGVADLFVLTAHYNCRLGRLPRLLWTGKRKRKVD